MADKQVAGILAPKLASYVGIPNRGVKQEQWAILGVNASIPAILSEGGFMDHPTDKPIIKSATGQENYARAIADTVIQYLGLTKSNTSYPTHTVVAGDTLYALANLYGTTVAQIQSWNGLGASTTIYVGQVLRVG